jgi:hypothetical protein
MTSFYVRRDDPSEKVKIVSQARSPEGPCRFEFIAPEHHKGKFETLSNSTFQREYKPEREPPPARPTKPLSTDSKDEWRAWALMLEADLAHANRSIERAQRDNPGWW